MQKVTVLGSTGSIGVNTVNVLQQHRERYHVFALTGHRNVTLLAQQCNDVHPDYAVMADEQKASELRQRLDKQCKTQVLSGVQALIDVSEAPEVDIVMAAIVGGAGLMPTFRAAQAGKKLLLANKEALVMSGALFMETVKDNQCQLLPIDSEHNAIYQCLPQTGINASLSHKNDSLSKKGVSRILLTGSGGPFRQLPLEQFTDIDIAQACAHPNWDMGQKISVDSATMMNKGLEFIEACWLFDAKASDIEVVLHPQSIIHSMVCYNDGSVIAQMGQPDMRTPIAYGLAYPERIESGVAALDFAKIAQLSFAKPDQQRYPCLYLAQQAFELGGNASVILNAANEIAVQSFLDEKIAFLDIANIVESMLETANSQLPRTIEDVIEIDQECRIQTEHYILSNYSSIHPPSSR